ncbi:MAG: NADH-quinone oxidoreductase subunit L, partial [Planctomycetes bacterium]|nr:NADH-quinone oxidoreductase subunit L [Planctomycetota bacterium]
MTTSFLWLIPFFPLVGFVINGLLSMASGRGRRGPATGFVATIACLAPALSFVLAWMCWSRLGNVLPNVQGQEGYRGQALPLAQTLWAWIEGGGFSLSLGLQVDRLTCLMLLFVTGIGTLIHIYSIGYMHADRGFARFMAYLNLFMVSMIVLVMGDSLPAAFLGWEGVGLCSYLLIGFWWKDHANNDAARKAFIMNRIGDLGFVLGAFALYVAMRGIADDIAAQVAAMPTAEVTAGTNPKLRELAATLGGNVSLSFSAIATFFAFETLPLMHTAIAGQAGWLGAATLLIFLGCTGKSAQLPLLTWLPDAMAGPTPVSALIHAATMVTAGIYLVARLAPVFALTPDTMQVILWIGCATALFGAIAGIVQNDIKKVLAYSTVSQLGFMFMAVGVGAFDVALFHVFTHAFFKATLFLGAGSVIHALHHEQDIRRMGGLAKAMPWTHGMMLFAFAAIIGFPATSGFFSKDLILERLHHDHSASAQWVFAIAVLTAAITAFYMTRMMCLVFWSPSRLSAEQRSHVHEAPFSMTLPVVVLG